VGAGAGAGAGAGQTVVGCMYVFMCVEKLVGTVGALPVDKWCA
jgi:hypothetical protein